MLPALLKVPDSTKPRPMHPEFESPPPADPEDQPFSTDSAEAGLNRLGAELAAQRDLNRQMTADFEGFRRRSQQDIAARAASQKEAFIRQLLPVIDNLERALSAGASPDSRPLLQGVEMTLRQLWALVREHGVEPEESVGQEFDPRRHEAVSQRHDPARPDQSILEVLQRGYRLGGNVLRPALVVINNRTPSGPTRNAR